MSEPVQTVEQLVAARELRGLSVADVSQQLKLAPRQVQAIEQGDWEALPGPAFTRAVLRGYGRLLGVDVDGLVASLASVSTVTDLRPTSSLDAPIRAPGVFGFSSGGSGSSLAWVGLLVLGLVALALFFGGEGGVSNLRSWIGAGNDEVPGQQAGDATNAGSKTATTATVELPLQGAVPTDQGDQRSAKAGGGAAPAGKAAGAPAGQAAPASPSSSGAAPASAPAPDTAAAPGSAATSASATAAPAPKAASATELAANADKSTAAPAAAASASAAPAGARERTVTLRFERESWIEIRGSDGTVLVSGTQQAGTSRSVAFSGRASLVIGNSAYVKVELDAKPYDIGPSSQAGVARFTLP